MVSLNIKQFKYGVILSTVIAVIMLGGSLFFGKNEFFLIINGDLGLAADYILAACTDLGNGVVWVPALLITLFILKKPRAWPLLVSGFVISTLLTQVPKNILATPRPWSAITNHALIHHASFVEPSGMFSFPSGHTMTAFTLYLTFCLLLNKKWWLYIGLIYAMLVGYSRIYLAQHFPIDVVAGIVGGIISTWLSLLIQQAVDRKSALKKQPKAL